MCHWTGRTPCIPPWCPWLHVEVLKVFWTWASIVLLVVIFTCTAALAVNNDKLPAPVYPGGIIPMFKHESTRGSVLFNKGAMDMANTLSNSFYGLNVPPPRGSIYGVSSQWYNFSKMLMRGLAQWGAQDHNATEEQLYTSVYINCYSDTILLQSLSINSGVATPGLTRA